MSRILRSMLYVPANSSKMINKAVTLPADAVILDLEDSVPIAEKDAGRTLTRDSISMCKEAGRDVFVRVNSMGSGMTAEDISCVVVKGLDGIVLAKTETVEEVSRLDEMLGEEEKKKGLEPNSIGILPLVESPRGVQNAFDIAAASPRLVGLTFGAADFLREMGTGFAVTRLSAEQYYSLLLHARSHIAQAARANGIDAIDTPFFGMLNDIEGVSRESENVKLLGFSGKKCIHPSHIDPINTVFSPSEEDVDYARSVVKAYEEAEAQGAGAASFGGKMIDYAMYKMGIDMVAKADAIAGKAVKAEE